MKNKRMSNKKYTCPCCGYKTIEREDTFYDLCPVCFWETDPYQLTNPDYKGGANRSSLKTSQQNFILHGACEKDDVFKTRMPLADEPKDENFKTFDEKVEGLKYVKRHWNETTGDPKTDHWGTSTYYFETDSKGDILKQMVVYSNNKTLKYSNLHDEDEFGGRSYVDLDLTDSEYKSIAKSTFYSVWNIPIIEKFAENRLHFSGWYLPVFQEKIIYPNPEFKEDEKIISATLDNRFALDLCYEKGGNHFPRNGFFVLKIDEGDTGIHYFTYMNWAEATAATQHWINDIQEANKTVDVPKTAEEKSYDVRIMIDNQIVMSKLTTWRNMDWEVEKFRNITLKVLDETYTIINTFTDYENMLVALQKSLPQNHKIQTCLFCRFSSYHPVGNDNFGALDCFKNCKAAFEKVREKYQLFEVYKQYADAIFKVEETHHCEQFLSIKKEDWVYKHQAI